MRKAIDALRCLTPVFAFLLVAGCSSPDDPARVRGTVTLNGEPLEGAMVEFRPVDDEGTSSFGLTDEQGRYRLMSTFDERGAMPGQYIVEIRTAGTAFDKQGNEIQQEERVPARYHSPSELKRTVEPGSNTFDFDL